MYGPVLYPEKEKMLIRHEQDGWTVTRFHSYSAISGSRHRPYTYRKRFSNEIEALTFAKGRVKARVAKKVKAIPKDTVYLLELSE